MRAETEKTVSLRKGILIFIVSPILEKHLPGNSLNFTKLQFSHLQSSLCSVSLDCSAFQCNAQKENTIRQKDKYWAI